MKNFILFLILTSSTMTYAATQMNVEPYLPVHCDIIKKQDYARLNSIRSIQKLHEDNEIVTFGFLTDYIDCVDGITVPREVSSEFDLVVYKRSIFSGFEKGLIKKDLQWVSKGTVKVELTFDKNRYFKNRSSASEGDILSRADDMTYTPDYELYLKRQQNGLLIQARHNFSYTWKLILTEKIGTGSSLNLSR